WVALTASARRTKTTSRTTSAPTSSRLRESRSTSGPRRSPIAIPGRKSAISSALTHTAEPVLFLTSTTRATTAIPAPRPESSDEPKRSLQLGDARRISPWRERITGKRTGATLACGDAAHPGKRVREEAVLLGRARGDADRRRRPEAVQRADDHPFLEQGLEQL